MLIPASQIIDTPVMSLRTGKELARVSDAVINPGKLSIIAYMLDGSHLDHDPSYLRVQDIREIGRLGFIIDSNEEFLVPDDIINDKSVYDVAYDIVGKPVFDERKEKVGKVVDYAVDIDSFVIEQLIVRRPLLKSIKEDELIIRRSQVIKVTDDKIIIKSGHVKHAAPVKSGQRYVNPFRPPSPQPEAIRIDDSK